MQGNPPQGGPLFWAHYSFVGLDPTGLKDKLCGLLERDEQYGKDQLSMVWLNNPKNYKVL
jgi:hypothetical protein